MDFSIVILIIVVIGFIFSGILLLKQSAKKFKLTDEQLAKIKEREKVLNAEEEDQR